MFYFSIYKLRILYKNKKNFFMIFYKTFSSFLFSKKFFLFEPVNTHTTQNPAGF